MPKSNQNNATNSPDFLENQEKITVFFQQHRQKIVLIAGLLSFAFIAFFSYQQFYIKPLNDQAQIEIAFAQDAFENAQFDFALNGKNDQLGFLQIIKDYAGTQTANLANYYAGISYLNLGEFDQAIMHLKSFQTDAVLIGAQSLGAIGDAYSEKNDLDQAIVYYQKAIDWNKNKLTTPYFLKKIAIAYKNQEKKDKALAALIQIKDEFSESIEAQNIAALIAAWQ